MFSPQVTHDICAKDDKRRAAHWIRSNRTSTILDKLPLKYLYSASTGYFKHQSIHKSNRNTLRNLGFRSNCSSRKKGMAANASRQPRPPSKPLSHAPNVPHLLLSSTGSVATIKLPNIISALSQYPISIRVVLTESAASFLIGQSAEQPSLAEIGDLPNVDGIYLDEDEFAEPWVRGNKILHIELRRWSDLMVVAPLSANSLAKICGGLSDNLLLSTIRAWDTTGMLDPVRVGNVGSADTATSVEQNGGGSSAEQSSDVQAKKIIVVAAAMNTAMWHHPITQKHIKLLDEEWGVKNGGWFEVLKPIDKGLACGDVGAGAMREWKDIVDIIKTRLRLQ